MNKNLLLILCLVLITGCTVTTTKIDDPRDRAESEMIVNELYDYLNKSEINKTYKLFSEEFYKEADTNYLHQTFKKRELSYGNLKQKELNKFKSKVVRGSKNSGIVELIYDLQYEKAMVKESFYLNLQKDGNFKITIFSTIRAEKITK